MATTEINTDNTPAATVATNNDQGSPKHDEGGPRNDQDSPWKEALERFFPEFLAL
ncbi:hypothetical protein [Lamprobacter modestohalophilus]|uniref:hypothetical protein n=1 Tax=Lamprobacter modestohalophilus TaxID=1064514 RepID=UPI001905E87D|nr:hypothetical protein [Lamprobacter modestohalophilus]